MDDPRNRSRGRSRGATITNLIKQGLIDPGNLAKDAQALPRQKVGQTSHLSTASTKTGTEQNEIVDHGDDAKSCVSSTLLSSEVTSGYASLHTGSTISSSIEQKLRLQGGRGLGRGRRLDLLKSVSALRQAAAAKTPAASSSGSLLHPSAGIEKPKLESSPPTVVAEKDLSSPMKDLEITSSQVTSYRFTEGARLAMKVNCIKAISKHSAVYQYHVTYEPAIDSKNFRHNLLNQNRETIGKTKAFDGTMLFLPKRLEENITTLSATKRSDGSEVTIKITFTRALDPASQSLLPVYNIVFRKVMQNLGMCPVGRNFYDPQASKEVPSFKLSLWPGFVTSIKRLEGGLMLSIDVSHKVLRDETVKSAMQTIASKRGNQFRDQCFKELIGETVLTKYNNKNYKIDDIDWNMTPLSTFTTSKGTTLSFSEYYLQQYKIQIKDLKQPMLINRPKATKGPKTDANDKTICLVPELCYLTGISDKIKNDYKAMKEIRDVSSLSPYVRNNGIEAFIRKINSTPAAKNELMGWGLELQETTCRIDGHVLQKEKLSFGRNRVVDVNETTADFSRDASNNAVLSAVHIKNWILAFIPRDGNKARTFAKKLAEVSSKLGIQVSSPKAIQVVDDRVSSFTQAIKTSLKSDQGIQLVVCIFPTSRDDRYNAFKHLCCVEDPRPSQVILSKTIPDETKMGKLRSVVMKIAMQINCKLGGELWAVNIPMTDLMVCGIDVYHDNTSGGKSVAALVVSTNKNMTRWFSIPLVQLKGQEIMDCLGKAFSKALERWHEINHKLPGKIVVYRDGVGDGNLKYVVEHEVEQMKSCFQFYDNMGKEPYTPKLTFVVVSKRISTKVFSAKNPRNLENPPPGTVVDHTVTKYDWHDFFLISQHVRHGTVSPTHYIVVYGSEHWKPNHVQRLSYKLTHMYYNWPGTVRVPAPCQYAHKLAYLVGENVKSTPSINLWDRLFYL